MASSVRSPLLRGMVLVPAILSLSPTTAMADRDRQRDRSGGQDRVSAAARDSCPNDQTRSCYERNYSYTFSGAYGVGVCDGEPDGDPAYVRYESGGKSRRLDDSNGYGGGCADQSLNQRVYRHHVCEGVVGNDPCGKWVYP